MWRRGALVCTALVIANCGGRSELFGGTRRDEFAAGGLTNGGSRAPSGGVHSAGQFTSGGTTAAGGAFGGGAPISGSPNGGALGGTSVGGRTLGGGGSGGNAGSAGFAGAVGGAGGAGGEDAAAGSAGAPDERVLAIAAGDNHTCALSESGELKCWGENTGCQLGVGRADHFGDAPGEMGDALPSVALGSGARPIALGLGMVSSCALLEDGSVKCWGESGYGETGSESTETRGCDQNQMGDALAPVALGTGVRARGIVSGYRHTCVLTEDGQIKCWGMNLGGQLGIDLPFTPAVWGDLPDSMGDNLPFASLAPNDRVKTVGGGHATTCAILTTDALKCWGYNVRGEAGNGRPASVDNAFIGNQPDELGVALPAIALGSGRTAVSVLSGTEETCALVTDGQVLCWGRGVGDAPEEMGDGLVPVPLGTSRRARQIARGRGHTCALLDDGTVKCWGYNGTGRLGTGDLDDRFDPAVLGDNLPPIPLRERATMVAAGAGHSCALLESGVVQCWGANGFGQLGLGDTRARGDDPGEMGAALPVVPLRFGEN